MEFSGGDTQWELWFARMGHPRKDELIKTQRSTRGIPTIKIGTGKLCVGCLKGKQTVATFSSHSMTKTTRVQEGRARRRRGANEKYL